MLQLYRDMVLARIFDERVVQLYARGLIPGSVFPGVGEEATFVGASRAVSHEDYMASTHRGYAHVLAKGTGAKRLLAELLGKATGCCGGHIGQYAISDAQTNNLGAHQVLGDTFTVAVGAALAQKRLKTGRMVLALFGDGATSLGAFHESLNLSALWRLPVVWVCDNNLYSMSTPFSQMSAVENVADRACAYNMPGIVVDGNDVVAVYETVSEARQRALAGEGPTLVECKTYRHRGHSASDLRRYRPQEEVDAWLKRDPIVRFEKALREADILDDRLVEEIAAKARKCVDEAEEFAVNSPEPPPETAGLVFCAREGE
jgi:TPP-dependent pyruvate/acetoin dehydrogenase alpha subunit